MHSETANPSRSSRTPPQTRLLRACSARPGHGNSELLQQRRLHTGTIEDFAFDARSLERLVAEQLDAEFRLVVVAEVGEGTRNLARRRQEG